MRGERARSKGDGDVSVYYSSAAKEVDEQPLLDLRTRLVLWILSLFFLSLVYFGLNGPPV